MGIWWNVDTSVLETGAERRASASLAIPTTIKKYRKYVIFVDKEKNILYNIYVKVR